MVVVSRSDRTNRRNRDMPAHYPPGMRAAKGKAAEFLKSRDALPCLLCGPSRTVSLCASPRAFPTHHGLISARQVKKRYGFYLWAGGRCGTTCGSVSSPFSMVKVNGSGVYWVITPTILVMVPGAGGFKTGFSSATCKSGLLAA